MATTFGKAGSGLADAPWAANADVARVGANGERRTAKILGGLNHPIVVLHDVRIPIPGFTANIDHVVVFGTKVWLIDSKVWKPAAYRTVFGRTFRGWRRFKFADSKTIPMAVEAFGRHGLALERPMMVVHSSKPSGKVGLRWFRPRSASALTSDGLQRWVSKMNRKATGSTKVADPAAMSTLLPLVHR